VRQFAQGSLAQNTVHGPAILNAIIKFWSHCVRDCLITVSAINISRRALLHGVS
jgi:hypothetical protein